MKNIISKDELDKELRISKMMLKILIFQKKKFKDLLIIKMKNLTSCFKN